MIVTKLLFFINRTQQWKSPTNALNDTTFGNECDSNVVRDVFSTVIFCSIPNQIRSSLQTPQKLFSKENHVH